MRGCNVVDLVVIYFRVAMREYISKTNDIPPMRNLFRDSRSDFVEAVHGLPANLQHALHGGSRLLIGEILIEAVVSDKPDPGAAVTGPREIKDLFQEEAGHQRISGQLSFSWVRLGVTPLQVDG
jgi:hypothetical protein